MKVFRYFLCLFLVALMPVSAHAQKQLEQAFQQFVSTSIKGKTVKEKQVISNKAEENRRPFTYICYDFTLQGSGTKAIQPLLNAFRAERSNAYYVFVKPAGQDRSTTIVDMDDRLPNYKLGVAAFRNYHELCFEDTENPDYRYAYVLIYQQKNKKTIIGTLFKVYSIRPDKRTKLSNRNDGSRRFYGRNGNSIIVSPDGNWSIEGRSFDSNMDSVSTELNERMKDLNKQMEKLNLRMQELSQDDIDAYADKMSLIGDSMRMVGDSMRVVGDLMREEGFRVSTLVNNEKDSLTVDNGRLMRKFGIYYTLYKNYKKNKVDDSRLTSVANLIYELVDKYNKGKKDPQMYSVFVSSLNELAELEDDPYRKGLFQLAMRKLK